MPTWGNTDNHNQKPKFAAEREVREVVQLVTANSTAQGSNTFVFTANAQAAGVVVGQYVQVAGASANGYAGFFASNNTVASVTGNTVVLTGATYAAVGAGVTVEFDTAINFNTNKPVEVTYNADTVLTTPTRAANATFNAGNITQGWVHIQKKVNNDGTVRYLKETLVALANPVAANTNSGNTSWGQAFTGL